MREAEPRFVSLADALRVIAASPASAPPSSGEPAAQSVAVASVADATTALLEDVPHAIASDGTDPAEIREAVRCARVFRAALADAFDARLADLVREITIEIVARELRLEPADIGRIAERLIAERAAESPLRVRVAAADAGFASELPVVIDPALAPGDVVLECRAGSIDARLGVRLATLVSAVGS